jgi:hypothetical protein
LPDKSESLNFRLSSVTNSKAGIVPYFGRGFGRSLVRTLNIGNEKPKRINIIQKNLLTTKF